LKWQSIQYNVDKRYHEHPCGMFIGDGVGSVLSCSVVLADDDRSVFCRAGDVGCRGGEASRIGGDSGGSDDGGSDTGSGDRRSAEMGGK
jgi:hypothetical protein